MIRLPATLLGLCLFAALSVTLSSAARANMELGNRYARTLAACMNGQHFYIRKLVVVCRPVRVP